MLKRSPEGGHGIERKIMRKRRAMALFGGLSGILLVYVAWVCWPRTGIEWHSRIDDATKASLENYFLEHPPKTRPLTFESLREKLSKPYQVTVDTTMVVLMKFTDGSESIWIVHPDGSSESLADSKEGFRKETESERKRTGDAVPFVGRMFEERSQSGESRNKVPTR